MAAMTACQSYWSVDDDGGGGDDDADNNIMLSFQDV
jgi:hypothetical protein